MEAPQWEYFWLARYENPEGYLYWSEEETKIYPGEKFAGKASQKKDWLNKFGKDGWELAWVDTDPLDDFTRMYFKRQLQE